MNQKVCGRPLLLALLRRIRMLTRCDARVGDGGGQYNATVVGPDGAGHRWLPHDVDPYGLAAAAARFSIAPPPPG